MTHPLVADYLARLEAEARVLPEDRRAELVAEVRGHIDAALAEAGGTDESAVRNVLERLGPPSEIVVEAGPPDPALAATVDASVQAASRPGWGPTEIIAIAALVGAWVALALQQQLSLWTSVILWLALGALGMVLVVLSDRWSRRRKQLAVGAFAGLYLVVALAFAAVVPVSTSGGAAPSPSVSVEAAS